MGELGSLLDKQGELPLAALLFEHFPDLVAIGDTADGSLHRVNSAAARLLGCEPGELVGFPFRAFVDPGDLALLEDGLRQLRRCETVRGLLLRLVTKGGKIAWVECSAVPVDSGRSFLCIGRDVTERHAAHRSLETLVQSAPDALLALDPFLRLAWMNARCGLLLGGEPERFIGRPVNELLHPTTGEAAFLFRGMQARFELIGAAGRFPVEVVVADGRPAGHRYLLSLRKMRRNRLEDAIQADIAQPAETNQGYWIREGAEGSIYASDEVYRIFGCNPASSNLPDALLERVHPDDRQELEAGLRGAPVKAGSASFVTEFRLLGEDGGVRRIRLSGRVHGEPGGASLRAMGTVQDVTARYQMEASLRQERDLNSAILDTTGALMILLDRNGRVVRFNQAAEQLSGYRFEEMVGRRPWEVLVPPEEAAAIRENFLQWLKGKFRGECTSHWITRQGEKRLIVWHDSGVRNHKGEVEYVICTGIDMTNLREAERQLAEAEERNRRLVDLAFDVVLVECGYRIAEINPGGADILGAAVSDLVGLPITEIIHLDYRASILRGIRASVQEHRETPLTEQKLVCRDGSILDVEVAAIPTAHDRRPATLLVFRDISDRKRAEAALRAREHHFQTLAKVAPVGIYEADHDGDVVYVNERCVEITGLGYHEILGEFWKRHVWPDDRQRVLDAWRDTVREGKPFRMEYRFVRPDGSVTWVLNQATAERDKDGALLGFVGTLTDITKNKNDEEELRRYREELEQLVAERTRELAVLNRELEAFNYTVSHDLRAPLRAINGFGNVLWEDYRHALDEEGIHCVERICGNTRWMGQLIDGILALSRLSQQQLDYQMIDLTDLARDVVGDLRNAEPHRNVEFDLDEGLQAYGDERLLRVVLQNLLGNAWKYTAKRAKGRITFACRQMGEERIFYVEDNGTGFDMADAERLFRAFQRLHSHQEFEGTGVGLATVQRIIHRHGGRIWAEAEPDKGAMFSFTLR